METSWKDLETWDEAELAPVQNVAKIDPAAQLGMGVARSTATVARFTCDNCHGSGQWKPYPGHPRSWPCRKCRGEGMLKTDPQVLRQRRDSKAAKEQADRSAYRQQHADVFAWMTAQQAGRYANEFVESLVRGFTKYGSLTGGQLAAVRRNIERQAERAATTRTADAEISGAGFARLVSAFAAAKSAGLKYPKLTIGDYVFSPAGERSKVENHGHIFVKSCGNYIGKISPEGQFFGTRDATAEHKAKITEIGADPLAAAVLHGKQTGRCACCSRELENEESVQLGIGPICRKKWAL